MTADDVVRLAYGLGVTLEAKDGAILARPPERVDAQLRRLVPQFKGELLALLTAPRVQRTTVTHGAGDIDPKEVAPAWRRGGPQQ